MSAYEIPPILRNEFTQDEIESITRTFQSFDLDGNGNVDEHELKTIINNLGQCVSKRELEELIASVDENRNGVIDFPEFLLVLKQMKEGRDGGLANIVMSHQETYEIQGHGGAHHTFSDDEKTAFTEHINHVLAQDPHVGPRLPMDPSTMALFPNLQDGLILCKMINLAEPGTIDERALNIPQEGRELTIYQMTENCNLCVNAAKSIGCQVTNIGAQDIVGNKPILLLGLVWQIVRIQLLAAISLKDCPQLYRLLEEGEELADLMRLPPEQILIRWLNYHLAAAGSPRRVQNLGGNLADGEVYSIVLHQLDPNHCDLANEPVVLDRCEHVINNAKNMGVPCVIKPRDIASGNKKLNTIFVAQIFNTRHGLEDLTEEEAQDLAGLIDDDVEGTREERTFRMWINSLNIPDVYLMNLYEDLHDGVVILKVMDVVEPGIIEWRRVNIPPKNRFKMMENCNYCVDRGNALHFSMVNIGGPDIADKNKKLILGIVWQLMRLHTLKILQALSGGGQSISEDQIVGWANHQLSGSPYGQISNFHDRQLHNSKFLLALCDSVYRGSHSNQSIVDWSIFTDTNNTDDLLMNAKYVISVARKIGCLVFLVPEDITEVKSKMLMTFVACLWAFSLGQAQAGSGSGGAGMQ
jgi:plastin-1